MKDFSKEIWAYALKNAIEFGKADAGKVLPKLFQHGLDKKDVKNVIKNIQEIVKKVNSMKAGEKEQEFFKYKDHVKEREEKEEGLPELENAKEGKVITRLAPEPSKYIHIGHALVFMIQYLYAKKYKGKCLLRFDDTNPEKSAKEYYDAIKEDLLWLGIKCDKEIPASNDMPVFYKYAEQLIKQKEAFACSCSQEKMKELRDKMKECEHRKNKVEKNLELWNNMLSKKYKEGEITLRLKGDMKSNNGVMRDPVIFRVSYHAHFIQGRKYCVWPTYDFESSIEDSLNGVTHVIRSNELELREELHKHIIDLLKLKLPIIREIGRYQITGAETQGRIIREMIEKKEISGWDDPRLVTISALRRRGFVPEMFKELAQTVGLSKSSGHIDPLVLGAVNRKIIDPIADRYSFVDNPVEIKIEDKHGIKEVEMPIHPDKKETRKIKIGKIFVSGRDYEALKGNEIRLTHLLNIIMSLRPKVISLGNKDIQKINWVSEGVKAKILMPDGKWISGLAEKAIKKLKVGELIQFERFGFVRLDSVKKGVYEFWFSHK